MEVGEKTNVGLRKTDVLNLPCERDMSRHVQPQR